MELTFEKEQDRYVSSFTAVSDFNLHIEDTEGRTLIYQRTTENGEYDLIDASINASRDGVIDVDFVGMVYPKYIKIEAASMPLSAVVTYPSDVASSMNEMVVNAINTAI